MIPASSLALGISLRPATDGDRMFLASLYQTARPDLQMIDGGQDLIQTVVKQQYETHQAGTGNNYPNAIHFIVEKTQHSVGAIAVDFGHNIVHVAYLAFVPEARGHGYGKAVMQGIQQAAAQIKCPLSVVVWRSNSGARRIYAELGFQVEESHAMAERMVWYPGSPDISPIR